MIINSVTYLEKYCLLQGHDFFFFSFHIYIYDLSATDFSVYGVT